MCRAFRRIFWFDVGMHDLAGLHGHTPMMAFSGVRSSWLILGLPPLPQQAEHLVRQHHIAVLATLQLLSFEDTLRSLRLIDRNDPAVTIVAKSHHRTRQIGRTKPDPLGRRRIEIALHLIA
jgi:hypothetical protein